jgi:hypothetical protein
MYLFLEGFFCTQGSLTRPIRCAGSCRDSVHLGSVNSLCTYHILHDQLPMDRRYLHSTKCCPCDLLSIVHICSLSINTFSWDIISHPLHGFCTLLLWTLFCCSWNWVLLSSSMSLETHHWISNIQFENHFVGQFDQILQTCREHIDWQCQCWFYSNFFYYLSNFKLRVVSEKPVLWVGCGCS